MAEREANLPAECLVIGANDEQLTSLELASLSLFEGLKSFSWFYKNPGSTVLHKCIPGQVMCRQGEAGSSAFYILTSQDVLALRRQQVACLSQLIDGTGENLKDVPPRFLNRDASALKRMKSELEREIELVTSRALQIQAAATETDKDRILTVAKVKLRVALEEDRPKRRGLLNRLTSWLRRPARAKNEPALIHVDSNVPLDGKTLEANLQEGEVFGEMSCLNLAPRSATVSVVQDCYMLEFMRNVLDKLYGIEQYKQKNDEIYRARVLDRQVRQLSVFKDLTDAEFNDLRPKLELKEFPAGKIIFDEHEESDCLYLVRGGMVKVVKHTSALIGREEQDRIAWKVLTAELQAASTSPAAVSGKIWQKLSLDVQTALRQSSERVETDELLQDQIRAEFNRFISSSEILTAFGDRKQAITTALDSPLIAETIRAFPDKVKSWSDSRRRVYHRALLELAFPRGLPRRENHRARTLNYLGKGEILGEIGLLTGQPRSATCIAFDQHDRGHEQSSSDLDANRSRVELVKLNRSDLAAVAPQFRRNLEAAKERRVANLKENVPLQATGVRSLQGQTAEFDKLGLVQGQKLMLIDLEKCTRCGACVEACVDSHDDGRNRLYLDGPRFDKYLIPVTCRSCLDPVCLIGCPVGAIYRGDNGEINIRNHCIGCNTCTSQCPYGSIHKSAREVSTVAAPQSLVQLEAGVVIRDFAEKAVVCDLCSSSPSRSPACVYACPHDAALRVDARQFFGVLDG